MLGKKMVYTAKEVSELLQISKVMVYKMSRQGRIPAPLKLGDHLKRWRSQDIDAVLDGSWQPPVRAA